MTDDAIDALQERKSSGGGDYAPWWEPSEGDEIIGIVVEKHDYTDPGGGTHPVGTLRSVGNGDHEKGTEVATPTHSSLTDDVQAVSIGDVMLIEYEGTVKANTGRDMNAYATSILTRDEWQGTEQADDFQDVWENSPHYKGTTEQALQASDSTGNSESTESTDSRVPDKAIEFAEDVVAMNDGEVPVDELDGYLNDVRDYDVEPAVVVASSDELSSDGDSVEKN
jgi:hypothetical protein